MINNVVNFELQEKQSICWTSPATEILYGGSAGGGKSHAMRVIAIMLAKLQNVAKRKMKLYLIQML